MYEQAQVEREQLIFDNQDNPDFIPPPPLPSLFVTNSTPEGLEKSLYFSKGFFSAISSEKGLFNSLFGKSYGNGENNNDIVLNGFNGDYVATSRATREGYVGHVSGGIVCFAQAGSVETVLEASNGSGLSERFFMIVEPHNLGIRDFTIEN